MSRPSQPRRNLADGVLVLAAAWLATLVLTEWFVYQSLGRFDIAALIGSILCMYALSWQSERKANFALATISIGLSLYAAEVILLANARLHGEDMTPSAVVESLRERGLDAYPVVYPSLHIQSQGLPIAGGAIFPLSGIPAKTTVYCKEAGNHVVYTSDRYGFNNPDRVYESAPDIVLVGDSFAHGACVEPDENVAASLRRLGWRVVNLGYGGAGPLIELATLREYAAALKPRIVVWLYYEGNDLEDLRRERTAPVLLKYLEGAFSQRLMERQGEMSPILQQFVLRARKARSLNERFQDSRAAGLLRIAMLRRLGATTVGRFPALGNIAQAEEDPQILDLFERTLTKARDVAASWGGQLYFVYLPTSWRYLADVDQSRLYMRAKVFSSVKSLQIPIIDFHETVHAVNDLEVLFSYRGGHLSPTGYALLAQRIDVSLKRQATAPTTPLAR
jgi:hypothetical protein